MSEYICIYVCVSARQASKQACWDGGGYVSAVGFGACFITSVSVSISIYLPIYLSPIYRSTYIYICIRERTSLFAESIASILQPSALNRKRLVNPKHSPNATLIPEPPNLQTLTPNPEQKLLSLYRRGEALRVGRCDGTLPKEQGILRRF